VFGGEVAGGLDGQACVHWGEPVDAVLPLRVVDEHGDHRRPVKEAEGGRERAGRVAEQEAESGPEQCHQSYVDDGAEGRPPGEVVGERQRGETVGGREPVAGQDGPAGGQGSGDGNDPGGQPEPGQDAELA
jgi:hypothetical protein